MGGDRARTWKLVLSYDGGGFRGWQVQPGQPTVQGELRAAIRRVTGEETLPQGSGRTDAGVHALAQVASFPLSAPIPERNLLRALNRILPPAIRIQSARVTPDGFHARHSALAKSYEYRIFLGEICPPWLAPYVYAIDRELDGEAMRRAARSLLGEHDFTSFASHDPARAERAGRERSQSEWERESPEERAAEGLPGGAPLQANVHAQLRASVQANMRGNVRRLTVSEWLTGNQARCEAGVGAFPPAGLGVAAGLASASPALAPPGEFLLYRVRGNGFLHHMVRNLVGVFLEIGRGERRPEDLAGILAARARSAAGATAPARGLFLRAVEYPEDL